MKKFDEVEIETKLVNKTAQLPTRGSSQAAGYDLYANIEKDIIINPHETIKIGTGIAIKIPEGYFGGIFPRSGIATKQGLRCANCIGVIDSDFRNEVIVALHNDSDYPQKIIKNQRIAQLIIIPYAPIDFTIVDKLDMTDDRGGGFGHTGD